MDSGCENCWKRRVGAELVRLRMAPKAIVCIMRSPRLLDVVTSLVSLILALPAMIVAGVLIKLTSAGPVFCKQERVGESGKLFTLYKFRTMTDNTKERVTLVGRILHGMYLDELPQLFNVLRGDMGFVGPWLENRSSSRISCPQMQYRAFTIQEAYARRLSRLLPAYYRRAIIGDLLEDCYELLSNGTTDKQVHQYISREILSAMARTWSATLVTAMKRALSTK